jgi:hypothetical protein
MSTERYPPVEEQNSQEVFLERVLGRPVFAANQQRVGRLEEFRVERRGASYVVTEYVIGPAGLFERLGLGVRLLIGLKRRGYVARWDQLDLSDVNRPRLLCPLGELREG